MITFQPNDKVVCTDDDPFPYLAPDLAQHINVKGTPPPADPRRCLKGFEFPGGFIEEGAVYCVSNISIGSNGVQALSLVGKPVLYMGREIYWNCYRFRRISQYSPDKTSNSSYLHPPF